MCAATAKDTEQQFRKHEYLIDESSDDSSDDESTEVDPAFMHTMRTLQRLHQNSAFTLRHSGTPDETTAQRHDKQAKKLNKVITETIADKKREKELASLSKNMESQFNEKLNTVHNELARTDQRLQYVETDVKQLKEISTALQVHVNKTATHEALIKAIEAHPKKKRIFDTVAKMFSVMATGYRSAASGVIPRKEDTYGDKARQGIDFLGNHVPAPFGSVFAVFSAIAKHVIDKREYARFYKIAIDILPLKIDDFSEMFSLSFIEWLEKRYNGIFDLNEQDTLAVGQRALGVILKALHDLSLNGKEPLDLQFLHLLEKSNFFISFVESKLKMSLDTSSSVSFTPGFSAVQFSSDWDEKDNNSADASKKPKCVIM